MIGTFGRSARDARQIEAGHDGKAHVGDDDVEGLLPEGIESLLGGRAGHDFALILREQLGSYFSYQRIVFHVQDA